MWYKYFKELNMVIKEKIREKINKLKENRYEIVQKAKDAALVQLVLQVLWGLLQQLVWLLMPQKLF